MASDPLREAIERALPICERCRRARGEAVLIGFQARFSDAVASGEKLQTIRALRKDGRVPRVGERLYLYTGLRTKASRKLGEGVVEAVSPVRIDEWHICMRPRGNYWVPMLPSDEHKLAVSDGFRCVDDFFSWFALTHGLPFEGLLIRWRLLPREEWGKP